jgi:hypothetical protein
VNGAKNGAHKAKRKKPLIIGVSIGGGALILALIMILIFTSSPIGRLLSKLNKTENYHMTATVSGIPLLGSISFEQSVDGNVKYSPASFLSAEKYEETLDDGKYVYTKNSSGEWTKKKSDGEGGTIDNITNELFGDIDELTNPKNYKKVKGEKNKYEQKDGVIFDSCSNVVITIEEDKVTVVMTIDFSDMELPATVIISEIGEVELTLPKTE